MTDLVEIIDTIAEVDEHITIRDLTVDQIDALKDKIVWAYNDRKAVEATIRFGGSYFRPGEVKGDGLKINTGSPIHDYEIKAALLLLLHYGVAEGGNSYKWRGACPIVRVWIRFAKYCQQRGQNTFRDIDKMPEIKLNDIIKGFLTKKASQCGMDAQVKTSNYRRCHESLNFLVSYGLVSRIGFKELVAKLTGEDAKKHTTEATLKYQIIPTGVMKKIIAEASVYIERAERKFDEFAKLFKKTHQVIRRATNKSYRNGIQSSEPYPEIQKLMDEYFVDLQRHVYSTGLAFTGMRYDEMFSAETDSVGHRVENGEQLYHIRSLLSKTDDNVISLDWACNEIVYRGVMLLSKINHLYYERARLVLKHTADKLTAERANKLEHGLKDRRLMGVSMAAGSVSLRVHERYSRGNGFLSLAQYRIELTDADIEQLNEMGCNYKSVHGVNRGKPYVAGDYINITPHQFRHTFAWFIVANRLGDLDDIKYQFKHLKNSMTYVYAQRGFESMGKLLSCIEHFEKFMKVKTINGIVEAAESGRIAGGGGEYLTKLIRELNRGGSEKMFGDDHQPHFKSVADLVAFMKLHGDSIRGLPHGYCTKGVHCKIKNASDPSHCLYCDTYYAIPKHLPYWRAIKASCEAQLKRIAKLPDNVQKSFQSIKQAVGDNLFAANKVIGRLDPASAKAEVT